MEIPCINKVILSYLLSYLSPQKRRYGDAVEYKMNKYSRIEQAKNLAFQWKASNTDQSEITQILQSAPNGQSVGLKAKVLFKGDKETVYSKHAKKNLTKCDIVVADTTGAITVTLWESQIAEVEQHSCYHFKELKLNWYKKNISALPQKQRLKSAKKSTFQVGLPVKLKT